MALHSPFKTSGPSPPRASRSNSSLSPMFHKFPPYLQQSSSQITVKFNDIRQQEMLRLHDGESNSRSQWVLYRDSNNRDRYSNIAPYAKNRVVLRSGGYINASHIALDVKGSESLGTKQYIATQGPKHSTWSHFWEMCWEQSSSGDDVVIVMLTPLEEHGREKCYPYWPTVKGQKVRIYDDLWLECVESMVDTEDGCKLTELSLGSKRIHHLYFDQWEDFSRPAEYKAVENLSYLANSMLGSSKNPLIVHCSAGVGRTGTFISLDYMVNCTKTFAHGIIGNNDGGDLVEEIVCQLRSQRVMMVQSEDQFQFLYKAARKIIDERLLENE